MEKAPNVLEENQINHDAMTLEWTGKSRGVCWCVIWESDRMCGLDNEVI